jgi:hypothetical protein
MRTNDYEDIACPFHRCNTKSLRAFGESSFSLVGTALADRLRVWLRKLVALGCCIRKHCPGAADPQGRGAGVPIWPVTNGEGDRARMILLYRDACERHGIIPGQLSSAPNWPLPTGQASQRSANQPALDPGLPRRTPRVKLNAAHNRVRWGHIRDAPQPSIINPERVTHPPKAAE